jgi:hypothetical protein
MITISMNRRLPRYIGFMFSALLLGSIAALAMASPVRAALQFEQVGVQLSSTPVQERDAQGELVWEEFFGRPNPLTGSIEFGKDPVYDEPAPFTRQAGSHPDFSFEFSLPTDPDAVVNGNPSPGPPEAVHAVDLDLPPGMIGNPNVITECDLSEFAPPGVGFAECPLSSQVGVAEVGIRSNGSGVGHLLVGVFNLVHGPDVPALFGFNYSGTLALIGARVRPGDYGVSAGSVSISQALTVQTVDMRLWGVPADP